MKLGDLCRIRYGKDHKKLNDGTIPVYGSGGVMRRVDTAIFDKPSVLIPRKGTIGNLFYVDEPFWTVDTLFWTDIDTNRIIPKYLYYQLLTKDLAALNVGTAVPSLTVEILNDIEIDVPTLDIQERITHLLASFDNKIALNNRLNDYLLELCAARYDDMRKDIADASNPKQGVLTDLVEVCYGKDHKKLADGAYPVYGSGGLMRHVEKCLYEGESVLIPRKGTLNNVMLVNGRFWTVDTMFYTKELMEGAARYAYFVLNKMNLAAMNAGSAVPSMTVKILSALPVILPSEELLAEMKSWSDPLFEQVRRNDRENKELSALRNALLPKLMSGEIDVSRIELPKRLNNHLADC